MSVCGTVRLEKGAREGAAERKEPGNLFDHHHWRISPKHPLPDSRRICFAKFLFHRDMLGIFLITTNGAYLPNILCLTVYQDQFHC